MAEKVYIKVIIGHPSLTSLKIAVVALHADPGIFISTLANLAKEKVCEKLNLPPNEVDLIDYKFFGDDFMFIDDCVRELVY